MEDFSDSPGRLDNDGEGSLMGVVNPTHMSCKEDNSLKEPTGIPEGRGGTPSINERTWEIHHGPKHPASSACERGTVEGVKAEV